MCAPAATVATLVQGRPRAADGACRADRATGASTGALASPPRAGARCWALTPRHLSFSSVATERLRSHQALVVRLDAPGGVHALVGNAGPGRLEFCLGHGPSLRLGGPDHGVGLPMALRCTLVRTSRRRRHGITGPPIASRAGVLPLLAGESPRQGSRDTGRGRT